MKSRVSYGPFADAPVDELFRGLFRPVRWENAPAPMMVKLDVTETPDGYLAHAEMPGVRKEDIDVAIDGNTVTIAAEVEREAEKKETERVLRSERYFGNVYRSFTLPVEIDESASAANYGKGVLELKLVAKKMPAAKKISVK